MSFRKTELLVLDGNTVLEDLREFRPLRIKSSISEVDDWRIRFFADKDARSCRHHLPVIVVCYGRKDIRLNKRSFLAGVDACPLYFRQSWVLRRFDVETSHDHPFRFGRFDYGSECQSCN